MFKRLMALHDFAVIDVAQQQHSTLVEHSERLPSVWSVSLPQVGPLANWRVILQQDSRIVAQPEEIIRAGMTRERREEMLAARSSPQQRMSDA